MKIIALLFILQVMYSFLSTCRINDAVSSNAFKYATSALGSDLVKYTINATIAMQVFRHDQWIVIITTALGGVVGNLLGHKYRVR